MAGFLGRSPPRILKGRKGFYIVSPMLGFFFFLITVSIVAFFIAENNQQIETSHAATQNDLLFNAYAVQSDAFDVYFQNYLQELLDEFRVGGSGGALKTQFKEATVRGLVDDIEAIYTKVYEESFGVSCETSSKAYSTVIIRLSGESPKTADLINHAGLFSPWGTTAIWPYISRYELICTSKEPPLTIRAPFNSRWYYLDSTNICAQSPCACGHPTDTQGNPCAAY